MMMNTRLLTLKKAKQYAIFIFFWLPIACFSLLLIYNTIPYFGLSHEFSFIEERAILFLQPMYSACFYIHIFAGMFCVGSALFQFSSYILKKRKAIHVWSGRVYVFVVLLMGAPTGMYMSFFAKGSLAERGLFMFMAVSWFAFTALGLTTILKKQVLAHKFWMMRSYAIAMTAVTFRVYYMLLYLFGVELNANYAISLWISVVGNIVFTEAIIYNKTKYYLQTFLNQTT